MDIKRTVPWVILRRFATDGIVREAASRLCTAFKAEHGIVFFRTTAFWRLPKRVA